MLIHLALRNVLRNRRSSAITVAAIAIGLAALTFLWAFVDGMNRQMIENSTGYLAGDMQVHLKGYHDDPSLDLAMPDGGPLLQAVRDDPGVAAASVRLEGRALASRADRSRGVRGCSRTASCYPEPCCSSPACWCASSRQAVRRR